MSQYTQFFIRHNDVFLPIASYSRSNKIAEVFQHTAPYEAIRPVTFEMLRERREEVHEQLEEYDKAIARANKEVEFLRTCTMEAEALLERYNDNIEYVEELKESKRECAEAISFINFLEDILGEAEREEKWGDNPLQLHENSYVYVGIEVGTPTVKDIKD